jgi:hypothetical protein
MYDPALFATDILEGFFTGGSTFDDAMRILYERDFHRWFSEETFNFLYDEKGALMVRHDPVEGIVVAFNHVKERFNNFMSLGFRNVFHSTYYSM